MDHSLYSQEPDDKMQGREASRAADPAREEASPAATLEMDVFGDETAAAIQYRTMTWPMVAVLMIAEIVSNGMLSLPAAIAVVGIIPGVILIVFLGKYLHDRSLAVFL